MALLCLLGRHGSGKSTLGSALTAHGFVHLSVGMLRRLASAKQFPSDVPPSLMIAMGRAKPGAPLQHDIAERLIKHAAALPNCVIDGFPASVEHLDLLPPETRFALVWTPKLERERRLIARAQQTQRQWTPGRGSAREESLASVLYAIQSSRHVIFAPNRGFGSHSVAMQAETLASLVRNSGCA